VPAAAAAATAALHFVESVEGEQRRVRLWALVDQLKNGLLGGPWKIPVVRSAIIPLMMGEEGKAVRLAESLRDAGVFIPAIRYPTVASGEARLRVTLTAAHTDDDVRQLLACLSELESQA
jgi:7-keto-8-aminopelargonate synthetase-like enzyme